VGWSYGGSVIGVAATGDASVSRLIYVNDIPRPDRCHDQDRDLDLDQLMVS
jgi:hypothetical protein